MTLPETDVNWTIDDLTDVLTDVISETHDMDVQDEHYARNVVAFFKQNPQALNAFPEVLALRKRVEAADAMADSLSVLASRDNIGGEWVAISARLSAYRATGGA